MSDPYTPDLTNALTTDLIRRSARLLIAEGFFNSGDLDDLKQDLALALLEALPEYDPQCARWSTYAANVLKRKAVSLCRAATADRRRSPSQVGSLSVTVKDEEGQPVELGEVVCEHESIMHIGVEESDRQTQMECSVDVQEALKEMPPELRAVCEQMMVRSMTAGAKELGIPRSTFAARLAKASQYVNLRKLAAYAQPTE